MPISVDFCLGKIFQVKVEKVCFNFLYPDEILYYSLQKRMTLKKIVLKKSSGHTMKTLQVSWSDNSYSTTQDTTLLSPAHRFG